MDALSYTEAESRSLEIFKDLYNSFEVVKINPIKVSEIFFNGEAEYWYKCKVNYITLDEKKGKEKKTPCYMYIQAGNPKDAEAVLTKGMQGTLETGIASLLWKRKSLKCLNTIFRRELKN